MAHDTNEEGRPGQGAPFRNHDTAHDHTQVADSAGFGPLFDAPAALIERRDRRERITRVGPRSAARGGKILAHLRDVGPLTALEAQRLGYGARLGARILELKQQGHAITTTMVNVACADGTNARVALYRLVGAA